MLFDFKIIPNIYLFFEYLENYIKFKHIEFNSKHCNDQKTINEFKNINEPKISIISPVYNREKYIFRFIRSIQIQNFYDLEMIFIDDNSSDSSVKLIKKYMKKDKRIKLIKNRKNRGTFKVRNIGVLYSKGKYVIIPDPDDILSNNILNVCYNYAEKYKYDFIRFNTYLGRGKLCLNNFAKNHADRPIYQPELSTYVFYGNKEIEKIDFSITNKFIKKKIYVKALNSLYNFYYNMYMTVMEDQFMNFLIYRVAKSFYYINIIGYRYYISKESINFKKFLMPESRLKFIFYYLKFIFEYSKNTKYEKDMANLLFSHYNKIFNIRRQLSSLVYNRDDFSLFENVINLYLNCAFINNDNKLILQKLKNIIK
jgi:glycosyltransferase involved in cell wall biosynthesis